MLKNVIERCFPKWRLSQTSLHLGLRFKLVFLIIVVSFFSVFVSSFLILTLQRYQLEQGALQSATHLSNAINASLEQAMLRNDRHMAVQIVQTLVGKHNVERIRILDAEGIVHISSQATEVGERFSYAQPSCQFCHTDGTRPSNQTTIIEPTEGYVTLLNVNVIYNQPQCQSCHDPQVRILGLTMIETPLSDLNNQLVSGFWRIAFSAIITFGLLIVLMTLALRHLIVKPIGELTRGITEIRKGNLDFTLAVPSQDEFGILAETLESMRKQLKASQAENARLYSKMRSLAILEERERLAREMHDNLAQILGYVNIKAALVEDQLAQSQIAQARSSLVELKQAAKEAYIDVRESIFYLRNAPKGQGLISFLREYLAEYRARFGIDASLWIEDERLAEFPDAVQVQINRIIQEALTNVRKHAKASRTCVRFERDDHHIRIAIQDDGVGFDPVELSQHGMQHFGLQIMRERAESVGGELKIDSRKGVGTRIILQVPLFCYMDEDPA